MNASIIVAMSKNRVIGKDNDMPWHLPADLKHFKSVTMGKPVLMGRKTYESIGRPLPNRTNFIVSSTLESVEGAEVFRDLSSAIESVPKGEEVVIIGGGYLFRESISFFNKLVLTKVDCEVDGDIFYPDVDLNEWSLKDSEDFVKDADNEFNFSVKTYIKNS